MSCARTGMACILLFMRGGPSQFETFDPSPASPTAGRPRPSTPAANGIQIAEGWTEIAKRMKDIHTHPLHEQ